MSARGKPVGRNNISSEPALLAKEDYAKVKALASVVRPLRSVLHKTPDDYGMTGWRDLYFPSDDSIPLEG